ncbi:MAG: hypothetical protein KF858_00390 [Candidatus Sumerlaeia bacterium]|nr:hypothetical protein [Candidatus Sumerlaeia bacterium]
MPVEARQPNHAESTVKEGALTHSERAALDQIVARMFQLWICDSLSKSIHDQLNARLEREIGHKLSQLIRSDVSRIL